MAGCSAATLGWARSRPVDGEKIDALKCRRARTIESQDRSTPGRAISSRIQQIDQLLLHQCGNNLPFCEKSDEFRLEPIRFAALKL